MRSDQTGNTTGALLQPSAWKVNQRVLGALLIRELLTRYGRNNIGFMWLFVEPMLFTLAITAFWTATRSIHGSDIPIVAFALTGYSSVLLWRNMASRCLNAVDTNKALLYHRQVTIIDVYLSRIILEILSVSTSFVALGLALFLMNWVPAPEDPLQVFEGWLLMCWFGAALALTIGGLAEKAEVIRRLWAPFAFILFAASGVGFLLDVIPESVRDFLLWLPMVSILEFMREGWFGSHFHAYYDISYVVVTNLILTFLGLSLVRQIGLSADEE